MRSRRGTSMVELAIVSTIAVALGAIIMQFSQASSDWLATISGQGVLRMQLAQVLNSLSQDVQEARQRQTPSCCGGAYTEDLVVPDTTIILQVPSLDANGNVNDASSRFDYIIYRFTSSGATAGQLRRTVWPDPSGTSRPSGTVTVARYLAGFVPTWTGTSNNRLKITQLAAQKTEGRRSYREPPLNDMTLEFSLRNWSH